MVVARGTEGEVGILAGHQPMLIQLAIGPVFIRREGDEDIAAAIDGGFMHVVSQGLETRVDILAEYAELKQEIDLDAARRQKAEAEAQIAQQENGAAVALLAKAVTRIDLAG